MQRKRPDFLPETRQYSQATPTIVQRPEGLDGFGDQADTLIDHRTGGVERYAEVQASPTRFEDAYAYTNAPQYVGQGETVLFEKDIGWAANSLFIDNWTNQWLLEPNIRRSIPPYSGGWLMVTPKGYQKLRLLVKAPPSFTPAAAIAGEWVWVGWSEAYLTPQSGIIDRSLTASTSALSPSGAVNAALIGSSTDIEVQATGAAAAITATLPAAAGKFTYITGFSVSGLGATAANGITVTVTGLTNTLSFTLAIPAGVTVAVFPILYILFGRPIPSSAVNTAVIVNVPSFGAGNTSEIVNAWGFQQ